MLYKITDEDVLSFAGLDAYVVSCPIPVASGSLSICLCRQPYGEMSSATNSGLQFLSFYTYAIRFLMYASFFAVVVILPIHYAYTGRYGYPWDPKPEDGQRPFMEDTKADPTYLWMYVVFTYVFTALAIRLLIDQTSKIIRTRQDYLGSQTSLTDRTIRLSGIPPELRSEEKIREFIEKLEIGKVDKVVLCRNWKELDRLVDSRKAILQDLEKAWTKHLGYRHKKSDTQTLPLAHDRQGDGDGVLTADVGEDDEQARLLSHDEPERPHVSEHENGRPTTRLWYGPLKLRHKSVDAIDYYEEKLRRLDEKIQATRQKNFVPTPIAFVTMESIASCQMAVQAMLDPSPMQLVASLAPAPSGVVWSHTYLSRPERMVRAWTITIVIGILTIFWSLVLVPFAYLLNLEAIEKVIPQLAEALSHHPLAKSLIQTGLPTLALSLLTLAVPFFYRCKDDPEPAPCNRLFINRYLSL